MYYVVFYYIYICTRIDIIIYIYNVCVCFVSSTWLSLKNVSCHLAVYSRVCWFNHCPGSERQSPEISAISSGGRWIRKRPKGHTATIPRPYCRGAAASTVTIYFHSVLPFINYVMGQYTRSYYAYFLGQHSRHILPCVT